MEPRLSRTLCPMNFLFYIFHFRLSLQSLNLLSVRNISRVIHNMVLAYFKFTVILVKNIRTWPHLIITLFLLNLIFFLSSSIFLANWYIHKHLINFLQIWWIRCKRLSSNNHLASNRKGGYLAILCQQSIVRRIGAWSDPTIDKFSIRASLNRVSHYGFVRTLSSLSKTASNCIPLFYQVYNNPVYPISTRLFLLEFFEIYYI